MFKSSWDWHKRREKYTCSTKLDAVIMLQNISYVESWDSQSRTSESQLKKKKKKSEIENARGFYETKLLIWRQTPKLCTTVYSEIKI